MEKMSEFRNLNYPWVENSIYSVFRTVADENRGKNFIQNGDESITYGELLDKVDSVSQNIVSLGLDIECPIAVNLSSGVDWAIVVLAILKSGHFYVPIDPEFPKERNCEILLNSKAEIVISSDSEGASLGAKSISVGDLINLESTINQNSCLNSGAKACVIYTSGSTGKPKGVIQTHQSILHGAWRRACLQNITENDRMTWLYSPSVKASEYCFFVALLNGATLHIRKIMDHFDDEFITWMASNEITVYHSVASYFRYVAGSLEISNLSLDHLRLVILGGERVLKNDLDLFFANFPASCRLFTGLGATETGTICHLSFGKLKAVDQEILPIGHPVAGVTIELLDEDGEHVKTGIGRLSASSKYISPGYWNETSERFKINPDNGIIKYTSGDLAEIDKDGVLHHRGRADSAVKVNGYLVNLLEVEAAIMKHEHVQEAIVIGHDVNLNTRLYAFIQPNTESIDIDELRSFLEEKLTKQMLPTNFNLIEKWPRLPNGKINRKELITVVNQPKESTVNDCNELEVRISAIWKKVLSVDEISVHKPFTEAGGDSVATLRLALGFRRAGFKSVNLVDLVKANTISKQAALIEEKGLNHAN
jgi:acyl-coenzyme A synthetase/AMP-(fatty) acid ligase/aryl carrier-like protein